MACATVSRFQLLLVGGLENLEHTDQKSQPMLRTPDDGSRTSLRTVDAMSRRGNPRVVPGLYPELFQFLSACERGPEEILRYGRFVGGDEETRTPDPLLAKEMLCQLSYVPVLIGRCRMVGVSGLEPETSALSGQCSNQLS